MKSLKTLLSSIFYLFIVFLIFFTFSLSVNAFSEGSGTYDDPYMIYTADDLIEVEKHRGSSVFFEQGDDIDLASVDWKGIYLYGNYNGNGFSIENLTSSGGLFRKNLGTIKNVKMQYVDISRQIDFYMGGSNYSPGDIRIGAIADDNAGLIENCYVASGSISTYYFDDASVEDNYYNIGGIAGISEGTIKNCVNSADVTVYGSHMTHVGGICGSGATVEHCLNTGDVYAYVKSTTFYYNGTCWVNVAGVSSAAKIYDCANTGNITATGIITYCSAIVGMDGFYNYINNEAYFVGEDIMSKSYSSPAVECIATIPNDHLNFSSSDYVRTEEDNVSIINEEDILYMWSDVLNLKKPYIPYTMEISGGTERYAYVGSTGVFEPGDAFGTNVLLYFSPGTTDYTGFDIKWESSDTDIFTVRSNVPQISGRDYSCTCNIYAKKNGKAVLSAELPDGGSVSINIQVVTPLQYDIQYSSDVYCSGNGFYSQLSGLSDSIDFYFSFKNLASDILSEKFGDVLAPIDPITITATVDSEELSFSRETYQDTYTYTTDVLNAGRCVDELIMLFPNNLNMDRDQKDYTIKITVTSDSFATFTEEYRFSINRIDTFIDKHIKFVSENATYRTSKKNIYGDTIVTLKNDKEYIWSKYTTLDFENYSQIVFADLMINLLNVNQCQLPSPVPAIISEWTGNYKTMLGGISNIIEEEYIKKFDLSETNIDKLLKKSKYSSKPSDVDDELRDTVVDLLGKKYANKVNNIFAAVDKTSQVIGFIKLGENVLKDIIDWGNKITLYNAYTNATKEFKAVVSKLAEVIPENERGMKDAVNDYINYDAGLGGQVSELLESFSGMMGHMTLDVFNTCIGKGMVKYLVINLINWSGSAIKIGGVLLNTTSYFSAVQTGLGAVSTGVTLGLCLSDILCDSTDKSKEMSKAIYMSKYTPYIIETLNYFENKMISGKTDKSVREFENAVALHKAAQSYMLEHTINSCRIKADSIIIKLFNKDDWEGLIADLVYHKNRINNLKCHEETEQYGDIISKSKVIIVECPVNVTVYDSNGAEVLKIENNSLVTTDDKLYAVIADTSKYISVPSDQNYTIKITAYDEGKMDYSVYEYNCDSGCTRKIITTDIPLTMNKEFIGTIVRQNDEPAERYALSVSDEKIDITQDISMSQDVPSVKSYFYGYIKDLYIRPYTNSKYQYRGDMNLLYTLIKPYFVTDVDSSGQVKLRNTLYSLRGGIGSNNNPYLSYYFFGNAFTDAKAVLSHYQATYGVNLNRMETISLSSGDYEINVFKTILGLIELLYLPEDSYNYSAEEYKQFLVDELGMSKKQFDLMTADDIEIIQQLALWYVIQSDEKNLTTPTLAHISKYPSSMLVINGDNDFDGYRHNAMNVFYTNLILKAIEIGEKYEFNHNSIAYTKPVNHFNKDVIMECHKVDFESVKPNIINPYDHYYEIGPFEIVSDEAVSLDELELFDATGEKIERRYEFAENSYMLTYNVYNENFISVSEILPGEKYYIRLWQTFVKDSSIASEDFVLYDANCIKIRISDSHYKTSADYISASNTEQDLVKVSKQLVSYSDEMFTSIHSLVSVEEKTANCSQEGYQIYRCSDDGCSYEYRYKIAKTEHNPTVVKTIPATCNTDGQTEGLVCNDCKTELIKSEVVPALGHSEVWYPAIESTCTENGSSGGSYCQICNTSLQKSVVLPKKEHNYMSIANSDYLKSEATCLNAAVYYVSCSECGNAGTSTFSYGNSLGHYMSGFVLTEAATCTKNGESKNSCSRCDYYETQTVAPTGHSYVSTTNKGATCTAAGEKTRTCSFCKDSYTETTPALGHSYSSYYTVDKKATCTSDGSKSKHCTRSGCTAKTSVTAIAKLAHTNKTTTTKATLTKNGKVINKCSVCGYSKTTTVYYPKTIKLSATSYTYNRKVKTPTVTVKDSKGNTLKNDTDYTVSYASGRKNTGKYAVTITFKGKYSGKKTLYFNILPSKTSKITPTCGTTSIKASWKKVTGASGYKVELLNSKGKVVKSATTTKTAYTFKSLSKVTTYKVRVTAYKTIDSKKVYSTSYTTITTSTAPAKVTLSKVSAGSKSATPTWKKVSGASGYEVMYSTSSKFSSSKTATVSKGSSTKTTIKKLTKGKKYYFKVRAYKTINSKKVYGTWSAVKSVKVK